MKLACFGAGEKSRQVRDIVESNSDHEIGWFIEDSVFNKIGNTLDGIPIISIYDAAKRFSELSIGGVLISTDYHKSTVLDMIASCKKNGFTDDCIFLVKNTVLRTRKPDKDGLFVQYKKCVQIYDLNIHLTDNCNLGCELCCHSAQLVNQDVFLSVEEFERDLTKLHELIPDICHLSLLGGEPLLHPNLPQFFYIARRIYPYSHIGMVTNGILLMDSSKELLESIKQNNVTVSVSLYPPMHKKLESLLIYFREKGLKGSINRIDKFFKKYAEFPYFDGKEMIKLCGYCMGLKHGKLARCIDSMTIGYTNARFGTHIPEADTIDIYKTKMSPVEIIHFLEQPMKICSHCANRQTIVDLYDWKQASKDTKKEDVLWIPKKMPCGMNSREESLLM